MKVMPVTVEAVKIVGAPALDPIHVFWIDVQPGEGYVTIICYGAAWTAYFGGMNGLTIREFFVEAGGHYLLTKLGIGPHLKSTKKDDAYLARIIEAVKASLMVPA